MSAIRNFFRTIGDQWSLIVGLKITGKYFFNRQVTVHYPRKKVDNLASYGGHVELAPKPKDPFKPKCITCMMCVSVCPSGCYSVVKTKPPKPTPEELKAQEEAKARGEKVKKKVIKEPSKFMYDYSLCSLCGLCIENCPVKSLRYSQNVYYARDNRKDFKIDLLARLRKQAEEAPQAAPSKDKKKA